MSSPNGFLSAAINTSRRHSDLTPSSSAKMTGGQAEQRVFSKSAPIKIMTSPPNRTRDLFAPSGVKALSNPDDIYNDYVVARDERAIRELSVDIRDLINHEQLSDLQLQKLVKIAIDKGDDGLIQALGKAGINLNMPVLWNAKGDPMVFHTPLTYAIETGKVNVIAALIGCKVNVNQKNEPEVDPAKRLPLGLAVVKATQSENADIEPLLALLKGFPNLSLLGVTQGKQLGRLAITEPDVKECLRDLLKHIETQETQDKKLVQWLKTVTRKADEAQHATQREATAQAPDEELQFKMD